MERHTLDEAADWFVRLHDQPVSESTRRQFTEWLLISPAHVRAFLDVTQALGVLDRGVRDLDIDELIRSASEHTGDSNVIPLSVFQSISSRQTQKRKSRHRQWIIAAISLAALVAAAILVFLASTGGFSSRTFRTHVGEQRSMVLDNGTLILINTRSGLRVGRAAGEQRIDLMYGEARFKANKHAVPVDRSQAYSMSTIQIRCCAI